MIRGGYGIYSELIGTSRQQVIQTGFSTATQLVPSTDNGQSFVAVLSNPFPQGIDTGKGAAAVSTRLSVRMSHSSIQT